MTLWLVCLSLDRAVRVRALAGTLCCSWARHFTLTVALSLQVCKRVPSNLMLGGGRGDFRCCGVDVFFNAVMR